MKRIYLLLFIIISTLTSLNAQLLTEDFNYTAGDQIATKGWTAHSAATTSPILVTTPGLTFTGYVGSNIGLAAGVNNTGQDVNKSFGAQTAAGNVYVSFMVNSTLNTAAGSYFFHLFDPLQSTAFRARTFITPKTGKMMIGFSFNASAQQDSMATLLNFGETYLFVAKYKIVDGATNDEVSLYVFKAGDDFTNEPAKPTLGPLTATRTTPTDPNSALGPDIIPTGIALRQYDAAQRITVDGFRVKTKWELKKDDVSSVNNLEKNKLEVYPNPVTDGYLQFSSPDNSVKQVEIFNIAGKKVMDKTITLNKVDVRPLQTGIYMLKIKTHDNISTSKFVVK
jgi:hypothetical protein